MSPKRIEECNEEKRTSFRRWFERDRRQGAFLLRIRSGVGDRGNVSIRRIFLTRREKKETWSKREKTVVHWPTDAIYRPLNEFQGPLSPVTARTLAIQAFASLFCATNEANQLDQLDQTQPPNFTMPRYTHTHVYILLDKLIIVAR